MGTIERCEDMKLMSMPTNVLVDELKRRRKVARESMTQFFAEQWPRKEFVRALLLLVPIGWALVCLILAVFAPKFFIGSSIDSTYRLLFLPIICWVIGGVMYFELKNLRLREKFLSENTEMEVFLMGID